MKAIFFLRAKSVETAKSFQDWYLHEYAPVLLNSRGGRLVINIVEDEPAGVPYRPAEETSGRRGRAYDVICELGVGSEIDALDEIISHHRSTIDRWVSATHVFLTQEMIEFDRQNYAVGQRSPGMKYISRLMFHPDLPDSAARRSWDLHVNLARRVHIGATKYVRNWVERSLTPNAPSTRGIVELHFSSLDDLVHRWFDSERGKYEIYQDVAHLVASGDRVYAGEYVMRA